VSIDINGNPITSLTTFNWAVGTTAFGTNTEEDTPMRIVLTQQRVGLTVTISVLVENTNTSPLYTTDATPDRTITVGRTVNGSFDDGIAYTYAEGTWNLNSVTAEALVGTGVVSSNANAGINVGAGNIGCQYEFTDATQNGANAYSGLRCVFVITEVPTSTGAVTSGVDATTQAVTSGAFTSGAITSGVHVTTSPLTTSPVTSGVRVTTGIAVATTGQAVATTGAPATPTTGDATTADITSGAEITSGVQVTTDVIATTGAVPPATTGGENIGQESSSSGNPGGISQGGLIAAILIPVAVVAFIAILAILEFTRRRKQKGGDVEKGAAIEMSKKGKKKESSSSSGSGTDSSSGSSSSDSDSGSESSSKASGSSKSSKASSKSSKSSKSSGSGSSSESGSASKSSKSSK
jgi:hypothetical protein